MITLLATSFLASLAGSLHCAAMCGPLVAVVRGGSPQTFQVAYHIGRIGAYVLLGAGAATLGHGIETLATAHGLEHAALVVAAGALAIALASPLLRPSHRAHGARLRAMRAALSIAMPTTRAFLFGAATGLMPCGWLYAWLAVASTSGSPFGGAVVMMGFGIGSVPALLAISIVFAKAHRAVALRSRRYAPVLLAASAIAALAIRGTVIDHLHQRLDRPASVTAPTVCQG